MVGVFENFGAGLIVLYHDFIASLPPFAGNFFNFFILVLLIVIYSIFIWKFYRFIAKKNVLGLDLNKYNKSKHPIFTKLLAGSLYFVEYIIILPFLIFFWFAIFTLFLLVLTQNQDISQILIISATVIAAIRMTSYYKENLSQEIAKILPFTLLAISVLNPNFFLEAQYIERIFSQLSQIPSFFSQIAYYLLFIIILEVILRLFDFIFSLFKLEEVPKTQEKKQEAEVVENAEMKTEEKEKTEE